MSSWDTFQMANPTVSEESNMTTIQIEPEKIETDMKQLPNVPSTPAPRSKHIIIIFVIGAMICIIGGVVAGIVVPIIQHTTTSSATLSSDSTTGSSTLSSNVTPLTGSANPTTSSSTISTTTGSSSSSFSTSTASTTQSPSSTSSPITTTGSSSSSAPSTTTASTTQSSTSTSSSSPTTSSSSTSSSSTTTASTTQSTSSTASTLAPLINPCSSGVYWNVTAKHVAGTGSSGISLTQISSPTGIFIDSNDSLYVADSGNYRVMKYAPNNTTGTVVAGVTNSSGTTPNRFSTGIRYIYVDQSSNLYVSDTYNNRVMRWANGAPSGVMVAGNGTFGTSLNQLYYPYGLWVDENATLYIAEYQAQRATKWVSGASSGVLIAGTGVSGNTNDKLSSPSGLYYNTNTQELYIANSASSSSTITKWTIGQSTGTFIAGAPGVTGSNSSLLSSPMSVTLDQWNNVYVADRTNNRVQLFCSGSTTGITIAGAGTGGSSLSAPYDVKLDSRMNLYVSQNSAARVSKFSKL